MKESTRARLDAGYELTLKEDRSIEYTIQFLQDFAGVNFDCVMNYLESKSEQNAQTSP